RFTARDILDLALVAEKEPLALQEIMPILRDRRSVVLLWMDAQESRLREDFANLEILDYRRSFDDCLTDVRNLLENA
ncbi:MAG: nucleotidyl transferase AbiEii/AbiGii toxin family protein, partial [Burkholderiales bacterium]